MLYRLTCYGHMQIVLNETLPQITLWPPRETNSLPALLACMYVGRLSVEITYSTRQTTIPEAFLAILIFNVQDQIGILPIGHTEFPELLAMYY